MPHDEHDRLPFARIRIESDNLLGVRNQIRVSLNGEDITNGIRGLKLELGMDRPTLVRLETYAYVDADVEALALLERMYGDVLVREDGSQKAETSTMGSQNKTYKVLPPDQVRG